ncbi:ATP-binding protein [Parendozoicomonas haliclonae]|uniref:histidine kinase n=1 Tax=Parendozoicomonas haliclonae TaxID=1960125 RepID=A0A1X7AN22_9GAMM|nr:ATP-binding protein [Parendozoicomonas haliclonae]SMA49686.1 Autoinducer 2 sensor kinase/phosphatase LuxQ [Parendozoicomonas haliclonae]
MWSSIRNKIVLFAIFPLTVIYSIIFAVHILETLRAAKVNVEEFMEQQAGHFSGLLNNQLQFIESIGETFTQSLAWEQTLADRKILISNTLHFDTSIHAILSGSPGKGVVYSLNKNHLTEQPWKNVQGKKIVTNQWGWSLPIDSPIDGQKVVVYKLHGLDNLYFTVAVKTLLDVLNKENPRNLRFEIVNRDSTFIYSDMRSTRPDKSLLNTAERIGSASLLELVNGPIKNGMRGIGTVYFRDWPTWYFASPVPQAGWMLLTHTRETYALADARQSAIFSGLFLLLALLVITACVLKVSGLITNPLVRLTQAVDKLGDGHWFLDYRHRSNDETGRLARSINAMAARLSERDEALKEMRASNISHIAENLRGRYFYYMLDERGQLIYISPSVSDILGYSSESLLESAGHSFLRSSQFRRFYRSVRGVLRGQTKNETLQLELPHQSGTTRTLELINVPIVELNGSISGVEGMGHDVTELVSDSRKFRGLLEAAPDAIIITDKSLTILMVNERAESLFITDRSDLVGKPLAILGRNQNKPLFPQRITPDEVTSRQLSFESLCSKSDGKLFPVEMATSPLVTETETLITIVIRDISDRKRAERDLRHARDLARVGDKTKTQFLSNMSHELRTPLNGILGHVQLMLRENGLSDDQRISLETIGDCGEHLLMLINDVLDLTRIESTRPTVQLASINLRTTLDKVCRILSPRAQRKGLDIQLNVDDHLPEYVLTDVTKLRQVLINLLGNGIKFTDKGHIQLKVVKDNDRIVYIVSDTGIGIAVEDQESIFSPFQQARADSTRGGTGLGLTICQRLVTAMGGGLKVASSPGCGSRFYFSLPLRKSEAQSEAANELLTDSSCQVRLEPGKQIRILVVDDSFNNRRLLVRLLDDAGFETLEAVNGEDALQSIKSRQPELVLMDIHMPVLTGVDALRQLQHDGNPVPVIALASSLTTESDQQYQELGFSGYISKPFKLDCLLNEIGRVLNIEYVRTGDDHA